MSMADKFVVPVDPEHQTLRIAVVLVFLIASGVVYSVVSRLVSQDSGVNLIAVAAALGGGALITQNVDRLLKGRWQSGRTLEIDGDKIRLRLRGTVQREIEGSEQVNVMMWRFAITKRSRVPKGWHMIAIALQQDDAILPVYTFVSPQDLQPTLYVQLISQKELVGDQSMRIAGQQRRLHTAEDARWNEGAEMTHADYQAYLSRLRTDFPAWMTAEQP